MIEKVMQLLSSELNQFLKTRFAISGHAAILSNLTSLDGEVVGNGENKIVLTLINIEQETSLSKSMKQVPGISGTHEIAMPPVNINLHLLVSAYFREYSESLKFLSAAISFFQQRPSMTKETTPALAGIAETLIFEIVNLNVTELGNLWGRLGGKYQPSVLYKVCVLTSDGKNLDWRYVNVRRTIILLEESIKQAAKAYVFANNTATTWVSVKGAIDNFLIGIWKRGVLAGSAPAEAFEVHVGLDDTMTPTDILEGIMRITVLVAPIRPAEFFEITFQQQMQKS